MQECFLNHSRMGTVRMKEDKETKRGVSMERSKAGAKKKSRRPITTYSKQNNNKNNIVVFYKIWKKYNEIRLKKKKGLEQAKNDKSSTLPH